MHGMTRAGSGDADTSREASTTVATCPTPWRRSKSFLYREFPMFRRMLPIRRLVLPRERRAPPAKARDRNEARERRAIRGRTLLQMLLAWQVSLPTRHRARLVLRRPRQVFLPPLPPVPPVVSPPSSSTAYVCMHARTCLVNYRASTLAWTSSSFPHALALLLFRRSAAAGCGLGSGERER